MRRVVPGVLVLLAGLGAMFLSAPGADALSCEHMPPGNIELVGTVVAVANRWDGMPEDQGTWARFAVEEVWRNDTAEPIGPRVEVRSGPELDNGFVTSLGAHRFVLGQRYRVNADPGTVSPEVAAHDFYWETPAGVLAVRPCVEPPVPWDADQADRRPADAVVIPQSTPIQPEQWPVSEDSPPYSVIVTGIVVVAGVIIGSRIHARRRADQPSIGVPT